MYNNKPFNPFQNNPFQNNLSLQQKMLKDKEEQLFKLRKEQQQRNQALHNMSIASTQASQFSLLIRNKMLSLGLDYDDVANMTGLQSSEIQMITLGSSNTSFENILRILSALKLNLQVY